MKPLLHRRTFWKGCDMTTLRDLFYGIAIVILVLICAALGMNLEDE